jgi:hypothetical protein
MEKDEDEDKDEISEDPKQSKRRFSLKRKITKKSDIISLWNLIMDDDDIHDVQSLVKDLEFLMDLGRINFTEFIQEEVKWVRMDIDITLESYDEAKRLIVPKIKKKSLEKVEEDRFKDQLEGKDLVFEKI